MIPQKKAYTLVNKFTDFANRGMEDSDFNAIQNAKQCALIAVEEILNAVTTIADKKYDYWQEVKNELLNIDKQ